MKYKVDWIHRYYGKEKDIILYKRLILSYNKNLNKGDYIMDDIDANGAGDFNSELIRFGSQKFSDWESVTVF